MSQIESVAKQVVTKMLPTPTEKGIDLMDNYYDVLVEEASGESGFDASDIDMEVRILLAKISQFGFSCLD